MQFLPILLVKTQKYPKPLPKNFKQTLTMPLQTYIGEMVKTAFSYCHVERAFI